MASSKIHLDQAEHNYTTAQKLATDKCNDWSVTSAFYSALHYFESQFINDRTLGHTDQLFEKLQYSQPEHIKKISLHAFRESLVNRKYPSVAKKFSQLKNMSQSARYIAGIGETTGFEYITDETLIKALACLEEIKSSTTSNSNT